LCWVSWVFTGYAIDPIPDLAHEAYLNYMA